MINSTFIVKDFQRKTKKNNYVIAFSKFCEYIDIIKVNVYFKNEEYIE